MAELTKLEKALLAELNDVKSGVATHKHTGFDGVVWRCSSPYCDRGDDLRNDPEPGPGETSDRAERYRREYNA